MIEKIEITGNDFRVEEGFRKYTEKRIGKLDRYLPKGSKKDVVAKVIVSEIGKNKGDKYEISAAMEIPGGKVLAARDECSNVFAGVDLVEAKLTGQIRRYKLEVQPHRQKRSLKDLFIKRR
ncbi:ribosome-associated translation inhibitor RaiA [Candidatus Saccharibacteria bacterium]|nr:ribosome-associated translation inhibitor RaiA [Candidatus Saccharibacteria bacterium]MBR3143607.1 ribosome-associated translation inhibitor RaiA [Candidatus Saccharibacteria bacterium]